MLKSLSVIMAAAAVAAALTIFAGPAEKVTAGPLPAAAAEAMQTCVGTPFGNPHVRLVTSERLAD